MLAEYTPLFHLLYLFKHFQNFRIYICEYMDNFIKNMSFIYVRN